MSEMDIPYGTESIREFLEDRKMAKQQKIEEEEKKVYKRPVLFLYKSKAGKHLYTFNMEREDGSMVLGSEVESLLINIADLEKVVSGEWKSIKVSVMLKEKAEG
jgi:hypothetical protein